MVVALTAAAESVTVPVDAVPPATLVGASCSATTSAFTGSDAVCCEVPVVAVMVTVTSAGGLTTVTANVPLVWPAGMRMLAGTDAVALALLESVMVASYVTAAASVTVPVAAYVPVTGDGDTSTEAIDAEAGQLLTTIDAESGNACVSVATIANGSPLAPVKAPVASTVPRNVALVVLFVTTRLIGVLLSVTVPAGATMFAWPGVVGTMRLCATFAASKSGAAGLKTTLPPLSAVAVPSMRSPLCSVAPWTVTESKR